MYNAVEMLANSWGLSFAVLAVFKFVFILISTTHWGACFW
jgi:hypothetical protein